MEAFKKLGNVDFTSFSSAGNGLGGGLGVNSNPPEKRCKEEDFCYLEDLDDSGASLLLNLSHDI